MSCRLDFPFDGPNGEEQDNTCTSPETHAHEIEGDSIDNAVHEEAQYKMDQSPSYHDDEFNKDHSDHHSYDDEAYQEPDDGPLNHRTDKNDNQFVEETVETYTNRVEPVNKLPKFSKPASYYGDGWEESSPPPPPPLATVLLERQRVALPVQPPTTYPHILEVIPHWTQFADPHAKKDVPFCKQLAQGGCSQGDGCRFRHSLTVEEYILLFNDQQPNLWTLRRDGVNGAAILSPVSGQPEVNLSHSGPSVVAKSSTFGQECKFYPIGKCRNGDRCPFQHTQHPAVPVAAVSNLDQDWQASERPAFGTQDSQRPCKYYVERGYCSRGLLCKFRHTGHPDGNHPSSGPSGPESAPSVVEDDKGWFTGREEGNKVNNNNFDVPAEDNGWGVEAAAVSLWEAPSKPEDHSEWDNPSGNADSHKPQPRNPKVCFEYAKGLCFRGMACKSSHDQELSKADNGGWPPTDDSSHSAPWNAGPPAQCPYYLKGNCRNESSCHMSHDSEEKPQEAGQPEESYKLDNPKNGSGGIVQYEALSTRKTEGKPKTLSENQPEAHKEDSQDSHILDNEATWSQPWPTETVQPPSFPVKIAAPCMRFGQGYCPFGDDCNYLHIEDTDIAEYTSEENVSVSISLNRCTLVI